MVRALKRLWTDRCTVVEYRPYMRENGSTGHREEVVLEGAPCRLSYTAAGSTQNRDGAPEMGQRVKLFLSPEAEIAPGAKLLVTRSGRTTAYAQCGPAARYGGHQELSLTLFERWA